MLVRIRFALDCTDGTVTMYRDVDLPTIFPEMSLYGFFGGDSDGASTVGDVEYDKTTGFLIANLADDDEQTSPYSLADVRSNGWYAGWTIEDFDPILGSKEEAFVGPVPITSPAS